MNYVRLVHEGKYKPEELSEKSKTFLEGMRFIQKEVENCKADCDPDENDGILGKVVAEIRVKTIEWLVERMEAFICEYIVATLDEEALDSEYNEESEV